MRAVLIVNPQATATTPGGRDVLAHALASKTRLDVVSTTHRGHATELAAKAVHDGVDLVVAHGGDGTVNEAVNGMAGADETALGVVPGGSANVFARAVGYPADPIEATHVLLEAISDQRKRRVGLGRVDGRLFTFSAGMGWDADTVAAVDRLRGKSASPLLYIRGMTFSYLSKVFRRPQMCVEIAGRKPFDARCLFVTNSDPWSYLGSHAIRLTPGCTFEGGIGLFAPLAMDPVTVATTLTQALSGDGVHSGGKAVLDVDLDGFTVTADRPVRLQVDGDFVGERRGAEFVSVPDALTVVV